MKFDFGNLSSAKSQVMLDQVLERAHMTGLNGGLLSLRLSMNITLPSYLAIVPFPNELSKVPSDSSRVGLSNSVLP